MIVLIIIHAKICFWHNCFLQMYFLLFCCFQRLVKCFFNLFFTAFRVRNCCKDLIKIDIGNKFIGETYRNLYKKQFRRKQLENVKSDWLRNVVRMLHVYYVCDATLVARCTRFVSVGWFGLISFLMNRRTVWSRALNVSLNWGDERRNKKTSTLESISSVLYALWIVCASKKETKGAQKTFNCDCMLWCIYLYISV
jgi:hypothetical protein